MRSSLTRQTLIQSRSRSWQRSIVEHESHQLSWGESGMNSNSRLTVPLRRAKWGTKLIRYAHATRIEVTSSLLECGEEGADPHASEHDEQVGAHGRLGDEHSLGRSRRRLDVLSLVHRARHLERRRVHVAVDDGLDRRLGRRTAAHQPTHRRQPTRSQCHPRCAPPTLTRRPRWCAHPELGSPARACSRKREQTSTSGVRWQERNSGLACRRNPAPTWPR